MKVGVVTFWYDDSNYGQILQCWALQSILARLGYEPFVIRFIPQNYQSKTKRIIKKFFPVNKIKDLKNLPKHFIKKINIIQTNKSLH